MTIKLRNRAQYGLKVFLKWYFLIFMHLVFHHTFYFHTYRAFDKCFIKYY